MRDGGKGDAQRPLVVPMDQFDESWDTIFNQKKEKDIKIEKVSGSIKGLE